MEDIFWTEWHQFQSRSGYFDGGKRMWKSSDITNNRSHFWHQKYTLVETTWLGKLACRVTSKINGIGNAERNWGNVKFLKSGQRSHLSSEMTSKQATIYGAACARRAERKQQPNAPFTMWDDGDLDSLGLNKFGVDEKSLQNLLAIARRVYYAWTEDWEDECIHTRDIEKEARLLKKYGGLQFDEEGVIFTISTKKMSFIKKRGNHRYCALGCKPDYNSESEYEEAYENMEINDDLHGLIYDYYKEHPDPAIRIITHEGSVDEHGNWINWLPNKTGQGRGAKKKQSKRPLPTKKHSKK